MTITHIQQLLIKHSIQLQHLSSLYNIHQLLLLVQQLLIKFLYANVTTLYCVCIQKYFKFN